MAAPSVKPGARRRCWRAGAPPCWPMLRARVTARGLAREPGAAAERARRVLGGRVGRGTRRDREVQARGVGLLLERRMLEQVENLVEGNDRSGHGHLPPPG